MFLFFLCIKFKYICIYIIFFLELKCNKLVCKLFALVLFCLFFFCFLFILIFMTFCLALNCCFCVIPLCFRLLFRGGMICMAYMYVCGTYTYTYYMYTYVSAQQRVCLICLGTRQRRLRKVLPAFRRASQGQPVLLSLSLSASL